MLRVGGRGLIKAHIMLKGQYRQVATKHKDSSTASLGVHPHNGTMCVMQQTSLKKPHNNIGCEQLATQFLHMYTGTVYREIFVVKNFRGCW